MYQFAYSAICGELPAPASLPLNCHRLTEAIELLEAADRAPPASYRQQQLLSDFRRLWLAIAHDLVRAGQELPLEVQADVISAANAVLGEIERRRFKKASSRNKSHAGAPELLL